MAQFVTSPQTARDEADRDGWVNLDEMPPKWTKSYARRQTARLKSDGAFRSRLGEKSLKCCAAWIMPVPNKLFVFALEAAARRLGEHPQCGRPAPPYVPEPYRPWSLPRFGYVLVYNLQTEPIEILRFVHTSRDLPQALAELRRPTGDADPV